MTFGDVVLECAGYPDFVAGFERLTGTPSLATGGINAMIDEASGLREEWCARFAAFVYEYVWCRLPREAFA